jgi:hypothetical protein
MSERQQINPVVTVATKDLLRQAAQERKCSQGELVESALLAFLLPSDQATPEPLLFERLLAIEEILGQMLGLLHKMIHLQEAQVRKPDPPPIATYDQMYGPIEEAAPVMEESPAPQPSPPAPAPAPRPRRLRRWFLREGPL